MKIVVLLLALWGGYWYVSKHYQFDDTLVYAKKHPGASWAPATDYYVAWTYYQRSDYNKSVDAFTQLLTDYPTCQYQANALFYLEDSAESIHDWETARDSAQRYAKYFPKGKDIDLVQKRLELMNYSHAGGTDNSRLPPPPQDAD